MSLLHGVVLPLLLVLINFLMRPSRLDLSRINYIAFSNSPPNTRVGYLWNNNLPKKCKFFIWSLLHNSLNTLDKVQRRHPSLHINPNWCILCKDHDETGLHLFITCNYSQFIWAHILFFWLFEE